MRAITLIGVLCCVPFGVAAEPREGQAPEVLRAEAAQDRGSHNWEGRKHYLYDDEYRPETDGAAASAKGCIEQRVRVRRADGVSVVKRVNKCD